MAKTPKPKRLYLTRCMAHECLPESAVREAKQAGHCALLGAKERLAEAIGQALVRQFGQERYDTASQSYQVWIQFDTLSEKRLAPESKAVRVRPWKAKRPARE